VPIEEVMAGQVFKGPGQSSSQMGLTSLLHVLGRRPKTKTPVTGPKARERRTCLKTRLPHQSWISLRTTPDKSSGSAASSNPSFDTWAAALAIAKPGGPQQISLLRRSRTVA
jgi:hypothetical protein